MNKEEPKQSEQLITVLSLLDELSSDELVTVNKVIVRKFNDWQALLHEKLKYDLAWMKRGDTVYVDRIEPFIVRRKCKRHAVLSSIGASSYPIRMPYKRIFQHRKNP